MVSSATQHRRNRFPKRERVVAGLSPYDVFEGRGTAANEHVGNIRFRRKIAKHYRVYSTLKDGQKHTLAETIVAEVYAEGGRFMKKASDGNSNNKKKKKNKKGSGGVGGVWVEVSHERAKKKAQTLLRAYTLDERRRQAIAAARCVCASPIPSSSPAPTTMTEAAASPVPHPVTPEVTPERPAKVPSFLALSGPVWTSFPALPLVGPSSSFSEDSSTVEDEADGSWSTSSLDSRPSAFLKPRASSSPLLAFWSATTTSATIAVGTPSPPPTSATIAVGTPSPPPSNFIMAPPPLGLPQEEIASLLGTLDGDDAIDVERILDQDPGMFDDFDEFFSLSLWE